LLSTFSLVRPPPLSLRLKLTLWTVAIFFVIQATLALIFQLYRAESINGIFNEKLRERTARIERALSGDPVLTDARLAELAVEEFGAVQARDVTVHVFDDSGTLVATTAAPPEQVPPGLARRAAAATEVQFFTGAGGELLSAESRIASARGTMIPMVDELAKRRTLVVIIGDDIASEMLKVLTRLVVVSVLIGVFSSAIAAYMIAGIAVQPINALTRALRRISPESIGTHVAVPVASSEMAELQGELELARKRIEVGFLRQERFMSNVSHEIKTPIAVMLAEAQTVKLESASASVKDFVRSISDEAIRLGRMVDSFLLLTRVRDGKQQVPGSETCLIREVLMDSFESCRPMAVQFGIRLDIRLPDGEGVDRSVLGNCDLLRTIFDNLLRNAIRFAPTGSLVTLEGVIRDGYLHASVRDQGSGIPPELIPHIFDRFSQAKDEARRGRGHGLGLEIAMGIAELHGGNIVVRNLEAGGAEFTVTLPVMPGQAEACSSGVASPRPASA
jgi:signal transduction histidine kinase